MSEMVKALGMALGANAPEKWGGKPPMIAYVIVVAPIFSAMGEDVYRRWRADREARRWR